MDSDTIGKIALVLLAVVLFVGLLVVIAFCYLAAGMIALWAFNQFGYFLPWTWLKAIAAAVILGVLGAIFK